MNRLPVHKRAQILAMLCEGASLRGASRAAQVSINTVTKLLNDAGIACAAIHDRHVRGIATRRLWCNRNWAPLGQRARSGLAPGDGEGVWTWAAIDADTELVVSRHIDAGDRAAARRFLRDVAARVAGGLAAPGRQDVAWISTAGEPFLLEPGDVTRVRAAGGSESALRLSKRLQRRRFTRLRNAFAKKHAHFGHMVAIYVTWHNFIRRNAQGESPAVSAGIAGRTWSFRDLVAAIDSN